MDLLPYPDRPIPDRLGLMWQRAVRLARRFAIAFGLATVAAILLGAVVTDNAFAQIAVTVLGALGLWIPFVVLLSRVERYLEARASRRAMASRPVPSSGALHGSWRRLAALTPGESQRLAALRNSLDRSRLALGSADLDPDAHDLCLLIDRRLPELIDSALDSLPPDDRNRSRQLGELVDLIEQFARHCSRSGSGRPDAAGFEAEVLRRRFEARLSGH